MSRVTLTGPTETRDDTGAPADATVEVVIDLAAGARIASIRLVADELEVEVLAPDPSGGDPRSVAWGSFPMVPWAGRLRHGRFGHDGGDVHLARSHRDRVGDGGIPIRPPIPARSVGDGDSDHDADDDSDSDADADAEPFAHAIHGTAFGRTWSIDSQATTSLAASCPLGDAGDPMALGWPFGGTARQTFELTGRAIRATLSVEADDHEFAAAVGWHPWFPKPDRLGFTPVRQYELDALGLPTGRLVEPGPPPWDDCFLADGPVELGYDRPLGSTITVDSDCDHWVVFDKPPLTTCVEPQSSPPDAANHGRWQVSPPPSARPQIVTAGSPLRRTMSIAW